MGFGKIDSNMQIGVCVKVNEGSEENSYNSIFLFLLDVLNEICKVTYLVWLNQICNVCYFEDVRP